MQRHRSCRGNTGIKALQNGQGRESALTGYTKKIAVIKQIQSGFSADSGSLSGVVKAETYAGFLKVEVSLINFAPLTEGRYVLGISDGLKNIIFEGNGYEGECDFNLAYGFAFLACFCNGACRPIASAACGQMACALPDLKEEMTKAESFPADVSKGKSGKDKAATPQKEAGAPYDDEAIAEENYYEFGVNENGGALRADKAQEADGVAGGEDEAASRPLEEQKSGLDGAYSGANGAHRAAKGEKSGVNSPPLSGGDYYGRMRPDIEKIFSSYPKEEKLERAMAGSRWAKIGYGANRYYVFGVLSVDGAPRYICYGVPSADAKNPPASLYGFASYFPVEGGGYWIMYQDAGTGVSVRITPA